MINIIESTTQCFLKKFFPEVETTLKAVDLALFSSKIKFASERISFVEMYLSNENSK